MSGVGTQIIAGITLLSLARLLGPGDFGIVTTAMIPVIILNILLHDGLPEVLIRLRAATTAHANAIFAAATSIASVVSVGTCITMYYGAEPSLLRAVIMTVTPLIIISALCGVPAALLKRSFSFNALAIRSLMAVSVGGFVGILMAASGGGVWSLVAQQWTQAVVQLVVVYSAARWRPGFDFGRKHYADVWKYSVQTCAGQCFTHARQYIPRIAIAIYLGPSAVGIYQLASRLALVLEALVFYPVNTVLLAVAASRDNDMASLSALCRNASRVAAFLAVPSYMIAGATANTWVPALVGPGWAQAVPSFQLLCGASSTGLVAAVNGTIMRAMGFAGWQLLVGGVVTVLLAVAVATLAPHGTSHAAAGVLAAGIASWPVQIIIFRKITHLPVAEQHWDLVPIILAAVVSVVCLKTVEMLPILGQQNVYVRLGAETGTAAAMYLLLMTMFGRGTMRLIADVLGSVVAGKMYMPRGR